MTRSSLTVLALVLGLGLAGMAQAQTIGYNIRTGDVWVDARLGEINDYGYRYRDPFIDEMSGHYGAPRSLLVDLLERRRWAPADVYYACAIAHALGLPCIDIVRDYDRHPDQGWGALARRYGIKPGSPAFHAFKRGTATTYGHWGYPVTVDRAVRVDWSKHGPRGATAGGAHGKPSHADRSDKGRGKGKPDDNSKGKGKNGKGKGKGP